jgi:hypothetical protein
VTAREELVLGIDTGFDRLGMCLLGHGAIRTRCAESELNSANLGVLLRQVVPDSTVRIAAVAVGMGPGKFSAIRTGMAFAMGLARADDARLYGVSLFQMLAGAIGWPDERLLLCSSGGGRVRFGQIGTLVGSRWRPAEDARRVAVSEPPLGQRVWIDPRDLGRPLPRPAAQLTAEAGRRLLLAMAPDESNALRPLYVARPSLGPAAD